MHVSKRLLASSSHNISGEQFDYQRRSETHIIQPATAAQGGSPQQSCLELPTHAMSKSTYPIWVPHGDVDSSVVHPGGKGNRDSVTCSLRGHMPGLLLGELVTMQVYLPCKKLLHMWRELVAPTRKIGNWAYFLACCRQCPDTESCLVSSGARDRLLRTLHASLMLKPHWYDYHIHVAVTSKLAACACQLLENSAHLST